MRIESHRFLEINRSDKIEFEKKMKKNEKRIAQILELKRKKLLKRSDFIITTEK